MRSYSIASRFTSVFLNKLQNNYHCSLKEIISISRIVPSAFEILSQTDPFPYLNLHDNSEKVWKIRNYTFLWHPPKLVEYSANEIMQIIIWTRELFCLKMNTSGFLIWLN
jgi:hypothetical protein